MSIYLLYMFTICSDCKNDEKSERLRFNTSTTCPSPLIPTQVSINIAVNMRSLYTHCAVFMRSLYAHCAVYMRSLHA